MSLTRELRTDFTGDASDLIRETKKAATAYDHLGDEAQDMGKRLAIADDDMDAMADALERTMRESDKAKAALSKLRKEVSNLKGETVHIKAEVDDAQVRDLPRVTERATSQAKGGFNAFSTSLVGLGVGAAFLFIKGISSVWESANAWQTAFHRLDAQLGQRGKEVSEAAGRVAGEVWKNAWGESAGEVTDVVGNIIQNLPKAGGAAGLGGLIPLTGFDPQKDAAEIETAANRIFAISDAFGEDANQVAYAARQLITTGLAGSWSEALDLIAYSAQELNDPLGELLDTFIEYPTQFRKLGLSGEQVITFLDQMVEAGAPSLDKAADALKEFSIRAVDGSDTTIEAFKDLGLAPKKMAEEFAAGGGRAATAFATVIQAIQRTAQTSPVKAQEIGVALFGTQFEDLGGAIFALDPTAVQASVDGAAAMVEEKVGSTFSSVWTSIKRTFMMGLTSIFTEPGVIEIGVGAYNFSGSILDALAEIFRIVQAVWKGEMAPEEAAEIVATLISAIIHAVGNLFGRADPNRPASNIATFFRLVMTSPQIKAAWSALLASLQEWWNTTGKPFIERIGEAIAVALAVGIKNAFIHAVDAIDWGAILKWAIGNSWKGPLLPLSWLKDRLFPSMPGGQSAPAGQAIMAPPPVPAVQAMAPPEIGMRAAAPQPPIITNHWNFTVNGAIDPDRTVRALDRWVRDNSNRAMAVAA